MFGVYQVIKPNFNQIKKKIETFERDIEKWVLEV